MTRIASSFLSATLLLASSSAMAVAAVDYSEDSSGRSGLLLPHSSTIKNRSLQSPSSNNAPITEDQYQKCLKDILTADQDGDYELTAPEFIRFVTFNSATYGYSWGFAAGQTTLDQLPLNFPMLFYTQACLCALENENGGWACCSADNAHVNIYAGPKYGGSTAGGGVTEKEDIYMREFCTEAYHSYSATFAPTPSPTPMPMMMTEEPTKGTPSPTPISTPDSTTASPTFPDATPPTPPPTRTPPQPPTTPQPTPSGTTSMLPVTITYGISSDCGVTGFDVMTANGNTIKDGLESATETIVIQILNATTWPWAEKKMGSSTSTRVANIPNKKVSVLEKKKNNNKVVVDAKRSESGEEDDVVELPHLIRYNELVPVGKSDVGEGGVTYMLLNEQQPQRQHLLQEIISSSDHHQQLQHKQHLSRRANSRRNLVFYMSDNVDITDVEDSNNDQACPPGLNCMIVSSVVRVTLEPGDDPEIVQKTVEEGLMASYQDGSFFQAIPEGTVLCPQAVPSMMPSSPPSSIMPSPASSSSSSSMMSDMPSAAPSPKSSFESMMPSSMASNDTMVPSAIPSSVSSGSTAPTPSTTGGNETMAPSGLPSTSSTSSVSSGSTAPTPSTTGGNETMAPSGMPSTSSSGTTAPSISSSNEETTITPSAMPSALSTGTPAPSVPSFPSTTGENETMVPSAMPSSVSSGGTASPSPLALVTLVPSMMPSPVATGDETETPLPTAMPSSVSLGEPTFAPTTSSLPTFAPTTIINGTSTPSASILQLLAVTITYDIENQCGLDSEKVMNEDGNTLKSGLIAATTTVAIDTLNTTFPREDEEGVYYTDEYPVTIDRVLDIKDGCDPGTNCLLIISTVPVVMGPGDDEDAVKKAITDGISQSFRDGSFNAAIPSDTVICPTRGGVKFIPPEPAG